MELTLTTEQVAVLKEALEDFDDVMESIMDEFDMDTVEYQEAESKRSISSTLRGMLK